MKKRNGQNEPSVSAASSSPTAIASVHSAAIRVELLDSALEEVGHVLLGFDHKLVQVSRNVSILVVEERSCQTEIAHTASTTNAVDVLFDVVRQIKVNDVLNVGNIQTTSGDSSGHQDGSVASSEAVQSPLALVLGAIAMNTGHRTASSLQKVLQAVSALFGLHKDQRQRFGACFKG